MEDHLSAISRWLTPMLLVIIAYYLKRFLDKNEHDHDQFFERTNEHSIRLTKVETEVDLLQQHDGGRGCRQ